MSGSRGRGHNVNKLEDADKIAIADKVYEKLNSSDWWKGLAEIRLEMGNKINVKEYNSDNEASTDANTGNSNSRSNNNADIYAEIENVYGGILKEIREFDPKYDISSLKGRLVGLKEHLRDDMLKAEWVSLFQGYVSSKLDVFALSKAKAKNVGELVQIMDKERKYCTLIKDKHPGAVLALYNNTDDNRIIKVTMYYGEEGDSRFADNMKEDALNISKFGIKLDKDEFNEIRNSTSHQFVADRLFEHCQAYATKFTSVHNYLKHEIENGSMSCYLKGTVHENTLDKTQEHTRQQMREHKEMRVQQMQMHKNKDYGIEM